MRDRATRVDEVDSDNDGLSDRFEAELGSNPFAADSDGNHVIIYIVKEGEGYISQFEQLINSCMLAREQYDHFYHKFNYISSSSSSSLICFYLFIYSYIHCFITISIYATVMYNKSIVIVFTYGQSDSSDLTSIT